MKKRLASLAAGVLSLTAMLSTMTMTAMAAVPMTGDERGQRMGLVIGLLVVSAVVLVAVIIFTGKKKK